MLTDPAMTPFRSDISRFDFMDIVVGLDSDVRVKYPVYEKLFWSAPVSLMSRCQLYATFHLGPVSYRIAKELLTVKNQTDPKNFLVNLRLLFRLGI